MKTRLVAGLLGIVVGAWITTAAGADDDLSARTLLASPDHPRTFWTGNFDKFDQYVQWNAAAGTLEGLRDVRAASLHQLVESDPLRQLQGTLPRRASRRADRQLYLMGPRKRHVTIGHLEPGVFGPRVELENDVAFNAYRHNGLLYAALVAELEAGVSLISMGGRRITGLPNSASFRNSVCLPRPFPAGHFFPLTFYLN
ncbi:MAG: hypothetical protein WDO13_13190 [Verrucomicrobiota bacterium]